MSVGGVKSAPGFDTHLPEFTLSFSNFAFDSSNSVLNRVNWCSILSFIATGSVEYSFWSSNFESSMAPAILDGRRTVRLFVVVVRPGQFWNFNRLDFSFVFVHAQSSAPRIVRWCSNAFNHKTYHIEVKKKNGRFQPEILVSVQELVGGRKNEFLKQIYQQR